MSKEELEKAPVVRLSINGGIIAAVISIIMLLGGIVLYAANKQDAGQVEKIVDYKLAPFKEMLNGVNEGIKRIESKLDKQ